MRKVDASVGAGLVALALAVLWSARTFPDVPGQKLGAAFLPMIVGVGLLLCGIALVVRSLRRSAYAEDYAPPEAEEHFGSAVVIVGAVLAYIFLSERIGFLFIAPLCLVAVFLALRVRWQAALCWAIGGTLVVHFAFYKLLRVPLPWGPLTPFY
ncbi:MAG TPA: tripartite tricarboxylate transporter TctB family protein [Rubrivivax sp.]|nr:tripartite tricarboxylate transporter TctB family protein [Rubrivivax sp.]